MLRYLMHPPQNGNFFLINDHVGWLSGEPLHNVSGC